MSVAVDLSASWFASELSGKIKHCIKLKICVFQHPHGPIIFYIIAITPLRLVGLRMERSDVYFVNKINKLFVIDV